MNKKKLLDKILMGAVIGGAIGSVVGASIKHKNNSKNNSPKVVEVEEKPKKIKLSLLKKLFQRKNKNIYKEIPNELEKK